ncbi:MAG: hypothetical protein EXR46_02685 [Dehalococcoidia bacterium]|nr:hypothetical protein [Dehalococcoidia bacterium]
MTQLDQAQSPVSPWLKLLIGGDMAAARRRMRNAWIAGFVAAVIGLAVAGMSYGAVDPEGRALLAGGRWALAFVLAETALLAGLSWGVVKRRRDAAAVLFLYFLGSRSIAYVLGSGNMTSLPVQILLGYLLFQGMRGAFTCHHLTHPAYPGAGQAGP